MRRSPDGHEYFVKVVIAGAAGAGKLSILKCVAARHGGAQVRMHEVGEVRVHRAGWTDWNRLGDGRVLHITVATIDGTVPFVASEELLVKEADGILFVLDVEPSVLGEGWDALMRVSESAQRSGFDLRARPLVLQYHRAERQREFDPTKLDQWLGVPTSEVPRFVTTSGVPDGEGMAFDRLLKKIVEELIKVVVRS